MKSLTVSVQIQFDQFGDEHEVSYAAKILDQMTEVLQERFNDISPIIFTNALDDSDVQCEAWDDEEENELPDIIKK